MAYINQPAQSQIADVEEPSASEDKKKKIEAGLKESKKKAKK